MQGDRQRKRKARVFITDLLNVGRLDGWSVMMLQKGGKFHSPRSYRSTCSYLNPKQMRNSILYYKFTRKKMFFF